MAINLFGISIPTPSLPNPFASKPAPAPAPAPKPSGGGTGGRSGGGSGIKLPALPSLPKISLPPVSIPKISPPKVELPKFTPPKIDLPKISLPPVSIPKIPTIGDFKADPVRTALKASPMMFVPGASQAIDAASGLAGALPKVGLPKVAPPKPLSDAGGAISGGIDAFVGARDKTYEQGAVNIVQGNTATGLGQFAGATAVDMMLPVDAANVANKLATGRGGELTGEDYLWAGVDTIGIAAAPFTLGASYALSRGLKGLKVGLKGVKATKTVEGVADMGKFSGAIKAAQSVKQMKSAQISKAVPKSIPKVSMPTIRQKTPPPPPRPKAPKSVNVGASKTAPPPKKTSAIPETPKVPEAPKQGGAFSKYGRYVPAAAGLGVMGLTLGGLLGGGGGAPEENPYDGQDDYPWWMQDYYGGNEPYREPYYDPYAEYGYPDEYGYYPPAYPDPLGLENYAQDACGYLEELPGVGGVYEEAGRRGLALPVLIGTVLVIVLVVAFLRSKKGKKMMAGLKTKITGKSSKPSPSGGGA